MDKATLMLNGATAVDRLRDQLRGLVHAVWLGLPPEDEDEPIAWRDLRRRFVVVEDDPAGIGPLGCLRAALQSISTPWLLFLACDTPRFPAHGFARLISGASEADADVVAATGSSRRVEPLLALYRSSLLEPVEEAIRNRRHAVWQLLDSVEVKTVPVPDSWLHNVNTPDDLDEAVD